MMLPQLLEPPGRPGRVGGDGMVLVPPSGEPPGPVPASAPVFAPPVTVGSQFRFQGLGLQDGLPLPDGDGDTEGEVLGEGDTETEGDGTAEG
ncbi:hypothetical protein, partial [Streptomyces sp. WAC07061]|uniref:hypothetical protein n=1 Tax=Streptomyces sp. WAC07061 TaxID=2487410 RepID=UPI001C8E020C